VPSVTEFAVRNVSALGARRVMQITTALFVIRTPKPASYDMRENSHNLPVYPI
jgi:hypothetical protein